MAHKIEINEGIASYAENGKQERAWHGLGQVFDGPMTVIEALEASHADYKVEMQPIVALTPTLMDALNNGTDIDTIRELLLDKTIENKMATMRLDKETPLGIVSNNYGVVQNADAFRFIDTLCSGEMGNENTPIIEAAGVLGKGERIFITAKFPDKIILDNKGNDIVEMYVVFTTSHDGTGAVNCMVTPTRVVCNNTLNFAMHHNAGKLSLKHSSNIMSRLDLTNKENAEFAFRAMNMYEIYKNSLEESFTHLANIRWAEKELDRILAQVILSEDSFKVYDREKTIEHQDIPTKGKNMFYKLKDVLHSGVGQEYGERGTALWALNGLTTFYQNHSDFKSEEYKFDSIQNGYAYKRVQKAYELLAA